MGKEDWGGRSRRNAGEERGQFPLSCVISASSSPTFLSLALPSGVATDYSNFFFSWKGWWFLLNVTPFM